jgi:heparan-alpha-glucosaminide N-acetyltransferase
LEKTTVSDAAVESVELPVGLEPSAKVTPVVRNTAVDAYRGFVMLLMMAEVMNLERVARAFPGNPIWQFLGYNQSHVEWAGCSLHDMIQPSFSFLVGVALPYSIGSRLRRGATFDKLFGHALWRSLLLVALGVFLRSMNHSQTYFTFEDTLSQIGVGYPILFLLGFRSPKWQWGALGALLSGYWLAWALYPLPGANFDWAAVGVPANWSHNFSGFAAHWNKNSNLGNAFDQWFLNLFSREKPFVFNGGGYLTLSFIPTLGTMILGLIAGRWLRDSSPSIPLRRFLTAGVALVALGLVLHFTGICPIVKRIWTPAWTLFSGGICFLFLSAFSWVMEVKGYKRWSFPLLVIGMNSIAAYLIAHLCEDFVSSSLLTNLSARPFAILGPSLQPLLLGISMLVVYWFMLLWMYRRKVFLRI